VAVANSLYAADVMGELGLQMCEWAAVKGAGKWVRIRAPAVLLSMEYYLSGFAVEQGIGLSNQKTPPFNCTDCAPTQTSPNEPAVTFARFLEYVGADAPFPETDCATIVGVTAEGALSKNVLSLRQQPASRACRFDTFIWIPEAPNAGVHVAAHAEPNSDAAIQLELLGATAAGSCGDNLGVLAGSNAMDGRRGLVQRDAACLRHCAIEEVLGLVAPPPPPSPKPPEPSPPSPCPPSNPEPSPPPPPSPAPPERWALFAVGALLGLGLVLFITWRVRRSLIMARGKRTKARPVRNARPWEISPGSPPLSSLQLWDEPPPFPSPKSSPKPSMRV